MRHKYARIYWKSVDTLIKFGMAITLVFLVLVGAMFFGGRCGLFSCQSRWVMFFESSPNEVGDTLAGVAGALAFMWIIVTVLLQGKELAAQRKELRLARRESAKMASALQTQSNVLLEGLISAQQTEQGRLLEQRLRGLAELFLERPAVRVNLEFDRLDGVHSHAHYSIGLDTPQNASYEKQILFVVRDLKGQMKNLREQGNLGVSVSKRTFDEARIEEVESTLELILAQAPKLSEADRQRVRNLQISNFLSDFSEMFGLSETDE